MSIPVPTQPLGRWRVSLVIVFLLVAVWYLAWRPSTFNPDALLFSATLYALEVFGFATVLLHLFMTWRLSVRTPEAPRRDWRVDVFIPTYNEPPGLVRKTLLAARNMRYPHTTWLLDDGNRPEMAELAEELGVRYLARGDNEDAKAGNLNHALKHCRGELVAVFDCDHAPHRDFLTDTIGFFNDERLGFVQTPQDFYNLDSYQHRRKGQSLNVWTEQSLFFRVIQRGKDCWNAAFFCGSCAILRRQALDDIGGFTTGTVTEDLHTSLRLHGAGWHSVYHARPLAFGLAPRDYPSFLRQRIRWGQGAMQVWRNEGLLLGRGLSWPQRLNYWASVLTYFEGWQKAAFYLVPVVVLLTGVMPIAVLDLEFLLHFVPYYLLSFWVFEELGRGYGRTVYTEQYNMGRFMGFMLATVGLLRRRIPFLVTVKDANPRWQSLVAMLPQLTVLAANVAGILVGTLLYMTSQHLAPGAYAANIFWALLHIGIGIGVVRLTLERAGFRRSEYRFPLRMPARVQGPEGGSHLASVEDISSDGFHLSELPEGLFQPGDAVCGELVMPGRNLSMHAQVRRVSGNTLGCRFVTDAATAADRDALLVFLYGSDLQWRLANLVDRRPTPLERLLPHLAPDGAHPVPTARHWCAAMIAPARKGESAQMVLAGDPNEGRDSIPLMAFRQEHRRDVRCTILRCGQRVRTFGALTLVEVLETPTAPIYHYRLDLGSRSVISRYSPIDRGRKATVPADGIRAASLVLFMVASLLLAAGALSNAQAADSRLALGGVEYAGDDAGFAFSALVLPLPGATPEGGWAHRYTLAGQTYRYDGDPGRVEAEAWSGEAALGYRGVSGRGWWSVFGGVRYTDTDLDPSDPGNDNEGGKTRPTLHLERGQWLDGDYRWLALGHASYTFEQDGYWVRGRLLHRFDSGHLTGPELLRHGDPDYGVTQAGWVYTGMRPFGDRGPEVGVKAGVRINDDTANYGYGGLELLQRF